MLNMSRARPAAAPSGTPLPAMPPPPALPPKAKAGGKAIERKMPQHVLPPYVEANFRLMTFIMTRAPKLEDFPHERCAASLPHTAFEHPPHTLSPLSPSAPRVLAQDVHQGGHRLALPALLQELAGIAPVLRCSGLPRLTPV